MNAMQIAQAAFDGRLPPPVSEASQELARSEWLYNATEQLVKFGADVKFQQRFQKPQGVTQDQFALAVDEHVNNRLADCKVDAPSLGWLVVTVQHGKPDKEALKNLLGYSPHPLGVLGEIAQRLLEPLADDALIAEAEDREL